MVQRVNLRKKFKTLSIISILLLLTTTLASATLIQPSQALPGGRWVITVTNTGGYGDINDDGFNETLPGALYAIDTLTDTVYGPFLTGQLGDANGGLFDISVTPDGNTAVISNFGNSTVFFVDVTNPTIPYLLGAVNCSFFTEDTAITPDGKYALVTDGGLSHWIASIDIATRTLIENVTAAAGAQAVAIAPDGTIVTIDYFGIKIQTLKIDAAGHISNGSVYDIPYSVMNGVNVTERSVNVGIAPDGETVLVMPVASNATLVYRISSYATLTYVGKVTGLPAFWYVDDPNNNDTAYWRGSRQSVAFSDDGKKAYVINNGIADIDAEEWYNNTISVLNINGPGSVSLSKAYAATLHQNSSSQLFGVDVLAVAQNKLYVGNPTISGGTSYLNVVNLDNFNVKTIQIGPMDEAIVAGVATLPRSDDRVGGELLALNILQVLSPFILAGILGIGTVATVLKYKKRY